MQTIILDQPGSFRLTETDAPTQPAAGEALLRVRRVGICGTDLHAFRGRQPFFSYPRILGHELGVEIVALGAGTENAELTIGDLCAVQPYLHCGQCSACRRGKTNCCSSLQTLGVHTDGGMREYITLPVNLLHKANGLSADQLAVVEMLCIGAHAVRRGQPEAGEQVLVIGAGPIGLGAIQFARLAGADVTVMELSDKRKQFCQEQIGVEQFVDPRIDPVGELRRMMGGELPTLVFDATGNVNSMNSAFGYVEQGGKLVFVGLVQDDVTFYDPEFHRREMTLMSSRNATNVDFQNVIGALEAGKINLNPWITHRATPQELIGEFANWTNPEFGVVKAMLEF
ncbi:MAG: zinc-binding alcohol dehydrogenase family protein [Caldilineaceae bacterium]|nr:zinc-binding alcohol dehydrogenase family protein [Caldilineaceae bacterium]